MKVLIVDDVQMARLNMKKVLEEQGIEIIEAESGSKALKLYITEKPDVVALDIDLPDINGVDVLKQLKDIDENVNVVIVTGISSQFNLVETFKNGAKYFMVKPIDLTKFVQVVKSIASKEI